MKSSAVQSPPPTDRDLVDRARDGDLRAFGELACRHQRRLYRLALHLLCDGTEAEDFTQEAFMRMHGALDRLDARIEPSVWLYRILVNLALQGLRARRGAPRFRPPRSDEPRLDGIAAHAPTASVPSTAPVDGGLYAALAQAIDALGETLRVTLLLVCIDGRSHAEAAEILGASETTIASRVRGAKRELHEALAVHGYDSGAEAILEPGHAPSDQPGVVESSEPEPCLPMGMEADLTTLLERWPRVSTERRDWAHFAARVEARIALTKRPNSLESVSDERLFASPLPEVRFQDFTKPAGQAPPPKVARPSQGSTPPMTGDDWRVHGSEGPPSSWDPDPAMSDHLAVPVDPSAPAAERRSSFGGIASFVGLAIAAVTFFVVRTGQAPASARTGAAMLAPSCAVPPAPEATVAGRPTPEIPAESPGVDPLTLPKATVSAESSPASRESGEVQRGSRPGAMADAKDAEEVQREVAVATGAASSAPVSIDGALLDSIGIAASTRSTSPAPTPEAPPSAPPEASAAAPSTSAGPEKAATERPPQGEVMSALAEVLPTARECLNDDDDLSRARVIFGSDGTVQLVTISGFAAGKPAESCIKTALGKARVSSFKDATYGATVTVRP